MPRRSLEHLWRGVPLREAARAPAQERPPVRRDRDGFVWSSPQADRSRTHSASGMSRMPPRMAPADASDLGTRGPRPPATAGGASTPGPYGYGPAPAATTSPPADALPHRSSRHGRTPDPTGPAHAVGHTASTHRAGPAAQPGTARRSARRHTPHTRKRTHALREETEASSQLLDEPASAFPIRCAGLRTADVQRHRSTARCTGPLPKW